MIKKIEYLGSLIARVFVISTSSKVKMWKGESDYELLEDIISYDEGDLSLYKKKNGLTYYIYFSMSTKIEIFKINNGVIICDGLFFNDSLINIDNIECNIIKKTEIKLRIDDGELLVFDATLKGSEVNQLKKSVSNSDVIISDSFASIKLKKGTYKVLKVNICFIVDNEKIILKGIQISPSWRE